ncbi:SGNH/GDSL hydrolase family protein [Mycolicibacterium pulveris]|uniref:Lysophospholipase n=1 Tax=Mycolicibacterium pulveris TaxID=36813 RepID=A0A7I7URI7_MYCPV|nr:SGNH/GDSL hydrolase family protein [Mycolicibacterium pulveris]MCV6983768.1 SGNH/GDSL hydrolase family protein [Mycolicibacterium pulveris]BBY83650.1 lysophospholipase [Mycolicibacterium pulveris]
MTYTRYVAIGDSQTEGLWDVDDSGNLVGFADRLATALDRHYPGLAYANLAVRGRRIKDLLDEQLPTALEMAPDLITVCIGMNDVTRPGRNFDQAIAQLGVLHERLARTGATVITTTFPDLARILPVGRILAARVERINHEIRTAALRHEFRLVDLYSAPSMTDPNTWSDDRVHGSAKGHRLFAAAAEEALGLPGSDHSWADGGGDAGHPSAQSRAYAQVQWTRNMLMPWVWRHLRGQSSGDGCGPKRPQLQAVNRLDPQER